MSRLDDFIRSHSIDHDELAQLAKLSPVYLSRLRDDKLVPLWPVMRRIALACSWMTNDKVYTWELFDRI